MSEEFMEYLFTHELTPEEYGKIVTHCCKQLQRLGYYIEDPWGDDEEEEEKDETNRIMQEDRD